MFFVYLSLFTIDLSLINIRILGKQSNNSWSFLFWLKWWNVTSAFLSTCVGALLLLLHGCVIKEEECRLSLEPRYKHLNDDLHVEITAYAPPAEAHARIALALTEIRRFLVPVRSYPFPLDAFTLLRPTYLKTSVSRLWNSLGIIWERDPFSSV